MVTKLGFLMNGDNGEQPTVQIRVPFNHTDRLKPCGMTQISPHQQQRSVQYE